MRPGPRGRRACRWLAESVGGWCCCDPTILRSCGRGRRPRPLVPMTRDREQTIHDAQHGTPLSEVLSEGLAGTGRRRRTARGRAAATPAPLTADERDAVIDVFLTLLEGLYAHLPL